MAALLFLLLILSALLSGVVGCPDKRAVRCNGSKHEISQGKFGKAEAKVANMLNSNPLNSQIERDVKFYYFRKGEPSGIEIVPRCRDCLSKFMPNEPLIIFVHGFTASYTTFSSHVQEIMKLNENYNIISVDWANLAKGPMYHYDRAANNVAPVGTYVACMLNWLINMEYITLDKIHYVGHSLGAQVGNHVARTLNHECEGEERKIGRLTALDPARPLFDNHDNREKVDPSDAHFVDVIHTSICAEPCIPVLSLFFEGLGYQDPCGHADFYPNKGREQPGCTDSFIPGVPGFGFGTCSHMRAVEYFKESISNPGAFVGCKCSFQFQFPLFSCKCSNGKEAMGWGTKSTTRGIFHLTTNSRSPYGKGDATFVLQNQSSWFPKQNDRHRKVSVLAI